MLLLEFVHQARVIAGSSVVFRASGADAPCPLMLMEVRNGCSCSTVILTLRNRIESKKWFELCIC